MLNLSTSGFGDEPAQQPVTATVNGVNYQPGAQPTPAPIKSLPGQTSLFSAGSFFDDDAEPIKTSGVVLPAPPTSATPFVDDTPPFDVPAAGPKAEHPKPELLEITDTTGEIIRREWSGTLTFPYMPQVDEVRQVTKSLGVTLGPGFSRKKMAFSSDPMTAGEGGIYKIRYEVVDVKIEYSEPQPLPPIISESLPNPVAAAPESPQAPTAEERGTPTAMIVEVTDAEAEYLYNEKLQEMETELAQLDLLVLAAKDELKTVSKEQQHAAKALRGFKLRGLEIFKLKLIEERQAEADEAAEALAAAEAKENGTPGTDEHGEIVKPSRDNTTAEEKPPFVPMVEPDNTETNWQNISVRELKINPKIIKRLIESKIDTLEKLEWRRRAVHDGAESWPSGIGTKKIEEIEAGIVQWFADRKAPAGDIVEAMEQAGLIEQEQPEPIAAEPIKKPRKPRKKKTELQQKREDEHEEAIEDELTEEEHEAAILDESQVIIAQGADAFSEPPADPELCRRWDAGYECCQTGGPVTNCMIIPGPERTAWIKGWLAADASMRAE